MPKKGTQDALEPAAGGDQHNAGTRRGTRSTAQRKEERVRGGGGGGSDRTRDAAKQPRRRRDTEAGFEAHVDEHPLAALAEGLKPETRLTLKKGLLAASKLFKYIAEEIL